MLPTLVTPFGADHLRDSVAAFLPREAPPSVPFDAAEALAAGWLELWYQPKIHARTLSLCDAEALVRLRHPTWGVVAPAHFLPDPEDPHFRAVSEFVIGRAVEDWHYFASQHLPIGLAINLPIAFLRSEDSLRSLCLQMPDHPAFEGMIIEVNAADVVRNLDFAKEAARRLQSHNMAISIDDVGAEWPALVGQRSFPFVEIKVDRAFVSGCSTDRLKRTVCRQILDLADGYGARTVAEGVETRSDYMTVLELGFDLVQGFLFAKPMPAKKFARTMLGRPVALPG
jgi:EAL domain-containing protein (putative c-di-GMP-specific phosphodiesterase class I)